MKRLPLAIAVFLPILLTAFAYLPDFQKNTGQDIPLYHKAVYLIPDTFDPAYILSTSEHAISHLLYEGLFSVNKYMEFEPALVSAWELDVSGTVYRFTLRKGVTFHDGSPLKIGDLRRTLERLRSENTPVQNMYQRIRRIRIVDDDVLEVELENPYPPFIALLAAPVAMVTKTDSRHPYPLGTGPFSFAQLTERDGHRVLSLSRFAAYHRGKPRINRFELWQMDEATAIAWVNQGRIHDTANWTSRSGQTLKDSAAIEITSPAALTWLITLNTTKRPLDNENLRRCLVGNFPQRDFIKRFIPDHEQAVSYLPPTLIGSVTDLPSQSDRETACSFNKPIELVFDYPTIIENGDAMCAHLREHYRANGINLSCSGLAFDDLLVRISSKTADLSLLAMTLDLPDVEYFLNTFESTSTFNLSNYVSPDIDAELAAARLEPDRFKRSAYYERINRELYDHYVTLNISHPKQIFYHHRCLRGLNVDIIGDQYIDYTRIALDDDCERTGDFNDDGKTAQYRF